MARGAVAVPAIPTDAFRKSHEIEGVTAEQSDYQIPIKVHYLDVGYFAENGTDDPLYTASYPRAVYYNGKTYMVYQGDAGYDPYIICYDHATDTVSDPVRVGTNPLSSDYHGVPVILIDDTGHIHVFYGAHHGNLKYVRSDNPEDITAWTARGDPTGGCSYPNVIPDNGDIHLLYRHITGTLGNLAYRLSGDNGATWGAENIIIETNIAASDGIYAYMAQLDGTKLHIVWRYYTLLAGHQDVFHAYLELADGNMYSMDGTNMGPSITKAEADANCLVVDSGVWGTASMAQRIDGDGYPYIIYNIQTAAARDYRFTRWNGAAWVASETIAETDEANNPADFILHSSTSITAFLVGSGAAGRGGDIVKWTWDGATWSEIKTILSEAEAGMPLTSPKVPVDYDEELQVIFCEYGGVDVTGLKVYASDGDSLISLQDSGEDLYLHEKCKTDFGDIRFTASDGITELEYFPVEQVDGDYALFRVLIPTILVSPNGATIYVYYGRDDATKTSDGEATFPWLFDDFDDYSINDPPNLTDWSTEGTGVGNTIDVQADPADAGKKCFRIVESGDGNETELEALLKDKRTGFAIHFRTRGNTDERWYYRSYEDLVYRTNVQRDLTVNRFQWWNGLAYGDFVPGLSAPINTWIEVIQEIMDLGESYMHWEVDGVDYTGGWASTPVVGMNIYEFSPFRNTAQIMYVGGIGTDNRYIFVRKFVYPEPTNGDWGAEEPVMWPF